MSNNVNRLGQDTDFSCKPRQKSQPLHSYTYQSADDRPTGQSLVKRVSYQRYRRSDDPRDPSNRLRLTENHLVYAYVLVSTHQTTNYENEFVVERVKVFEEHHTFYTRCFLHAYLFISPLKRISFRDCSVLADLWIRLLGRFRTSRI